MLLGQTLKCKKITCNAFLEIKYIMTECNYITQPVINIYSKFLTGDSSTISIMSFREKKQVPFSMAIGNVELVDDRVFSQTLAHGNSKN